MEDPTFVMSSEAREKMYEKLYQIYARQHNS